MQAKRLEFGICRMGDGRIAWDERLVSYDKFCCGCHNIGIWIWYFTWLSDECYYSCKDPECDCS